MRVIICGDRNWTNESIIFERLRLFHPKWETVLINGGYRGVDKIAERLGIAMGFEVWTFYAQWQGFKAKAGPRRNKRMLEVGKPDLVIAFHNDLSKSKGTADMCQRAAEAGVPVELWGEKGKSDYPFHLREPLDKEKEGVV